MKKQISITVNEEMIKMADYMADNKRRSRSAIIEMCIEYCFENVFKDSLKNGAPEEFDI